MLSLILENKVDKDFLVAIKNLTVSCHIMSWFGTSAV